MIMKGDTRSNNFSEYIESWRAGRHYQHPTHPRAIFQTLVKYLSMHRKLGEKSNGMT